MRARFLKTWSLAFALGALLGNGDAGRQAQADDARRDPKTAMFGSHAEARASTCERIVGGHELRAATPRRGLELALKPGFVLKLIELVAEAPLVLRIARVRPPAEQIAAGFVPIGPALELSLAEGRVEVAFTADQFRVREGHRLVLAVEGAACPGQGACWQLLPAVYENGRCSARAVRVYGQRLQFGSVLLARGSAGFDLPAP